MPLNKSIEGPSKHTGEYWVLGEINMRIDKYGNYFQGVLYQYKDVNAYADSAEPMQKKTYAFRDSDNPVTLQNAADLVTAVYAKIRDTDEMFEGAVLVP